MKLIPELLTPDKVDLNLEARTPDEAVASLFPRLRGASSIADYDGFVRAVTSRHAEPIVEDGRGLLIAHGRTAAVNSIALAAGRLADPRPDAGGAPLSFVFIAGIPATFDCDYLRVVGAIARACNNPDTFRQLESAPSATRFIELLADSEKRIS